MRILTTVLALVAAALPVSAQAVILTAENEQVRARDLSLHRERKDLVLRYTDTQGQKKSLPCMDVVEILFTGTTPPRTLLPGSVLAITTSGDRIRGEIAGPSAEEDGVRIDTRALEFVDLPFERLSRLQFLANRDHWPRVLPKRSGRNDLLITKANDHAEGTINLIRKDHVDYHSKRLRADKKIPFTEVSLIFFMDPEVGPPRPPDTLYAIVNTTDGSAIQGELRSMEKGILEFDDLHGKRFRLSASKLSALHFRNGRVTYLSDTRPSRVEENANYIRRADGKPLPSDLSYPWQADRSAAGTALSIGGTGYRKGIGVRAWSSLSYALEAGFKRFQTSVGVDDALRGGDVLFEVWIDDRKAFSSRARAGESAKKVDLDVSGATELRLVVDFGENANIGDFADWGAARLIK
jgi:hypothetical protein